MRTRLLLVMVCLVVFGVSVGMAAWGRSPADDLDAAFAQRQAELEHRALVDAAGGVVDPWWLYEARIRGLCGDRDGVRVGVRVAELAGLGELGAARVSVGLLCPDRLQKLPGA